MVYGIHIIIYKNNDKKAIFKPAAKEDSCLEEREKKKRFSFATHAHTLWFTRRNI
jgi:hypothetical protein